MSFIKLILGMFSSRPPKKVDDIMEKLTKIAFPGGQNQITEEVEMLFSVTNGKCPVEDLKRLLVRTKALFYLRNYRSEGKTMQFLSREVFQNSTETKLSNQDIDTIQQFYANYFGFSNISSDVKTVDSIQQSNEPSSMEIKLEKDGIYWGSVEISGEKSIIHSSRTGVASGLLHLSVVLARQNLNNYEKLEFCKWAELPDCGWTQLHYSAFAFAFVRWLAIPNVEFSKFEALSNIQKWLAASGEATWETREFSEVISNVFMKIFKNLPN